MGGLLGTYCPETPKPTPQSSRSAVERLVTTFCPTNAYVLPPSICE